jgi:uncharacterized protein
MSAALVPMPARPDQVLRVAPFFPFEESGRRLLFVVENAAFAEADEATWALASMLAGQSRISRPGLAADLAVRFGADEASAAIEAFERLEILVPADRPRIAFDVVPAPPALSSLVLHVAHDCNLRCGYCYADFGRYGAEFGMMTAELAIAHVDRFFDQLGDKKQVHVTFFGGEPLMNMPVVFAAHARAKERALAEGRAIAYGITTNGTLLTRELAEFFKREGFTVTVSIDGPPDVHDRLRPAEGGGGSYGWVMEKVKESGVDAVARVTLTRRSTDVARIVRHLMGAGFREVGVSPVATGRSTFDLGAADLGEVLEGMRALADDFVAWAKEGRVMPFSNLRALLEQIGAGDPRPLPCGAGTSLAAADNKGDWYACHRLVGDETFKIGRVDAGPDEERRHALLQAIHPRSRAPCQECWARYLCGGGCHHIAYLGSKVASGSEHPAAPWQIGDDFCDFLRSWYRLGLHTYARLVEEVPEILGRLRSVRSACSQPQGL